MFNDVDFTPGKVLYDDNDISFEKKIEDQVDFLKEDLFQVEYDGMYIIDVGWYPEFDKNGNFKILVIKNNDWSKYMYEKKCKDTHLLKKYMRECITLIRNS
ncbi:hypothetical protein JZO86_07120 [Enterococcus ureasiticus]|uniref:hypothetical protein n=1 Tax=Enterococcus TaxID=1350 RepID=UPI001A8F5F0D|nr:MULTISPECIES: hypothetical protein [Enterococcus]MBO0433312.1 hypothetical protein [Enterococcus sp. DIV0849a]MBO0473473.1 hypothetical protein [Enterococcus ureasiticus]